MTFDERLVRLAAAILPRSRRQVRLEEWLADLDGASELGLRPRSVALGALRYGFVHGLRERITSVRPRTVLIGGLAALGIAIIGVPVVGIAGIVVANARGIVTVETAADGSERTVHWREYPGIAGLDPEEVLAGPGLHEGRRAGEALVAEIRDALTAELGLAWRSDPHPVQTATTASNRYGGNSMLVVVNLPTSQSTSVPQEWADKQRAIDIISSIAAQHGFFELVLEHERSWLTEDDRIRDFGAANPEDMVHINGSVMGPAGQWLMFGIQDLSNDMDGTFTERFGSSLEHGWEPNTVTVMYGANGLLPEADRAEFVQRLEDFAGLERPEPRVSD